MSQPCRKDTLTRVSASRSRRPAKGTVARSDDLTNLQGLRQGRSRASTSQKPMRDERAAFAAMYGPDLL